MVYLFGLQRLGRKCSNIYNARSTIVRLIELFVLRSLRCRSGLYTAVSRKVVLQTEKTLRDNVESYYG